MCKRFSVLQPFTIKLCFAIRKFYVSMFLHTHKHTQFFGSIVYSSTFTSRIRANDWISIRSFACSSVFVHFVFSSHVELCRPLSFFLWVALTLASSKGAHRSITYKNTIDVLHGVFNINLKFEWFRCNITWVSFRVRVEDESVFNLFQ